MIEGRARRAVVVGAMLLVAAVVIAVQFNRLGLDTAPPGLPADAPPAGVALFFVRDPGHAHGLIAYDWSGTRRGSLTFPTWVDVSRLRPAPDGSGFMLDPGAPGDYAAYFDRVGRTVFETNDSSFVSQAWAADSTHVCVLTDTDIVTRLPGQPDRTVPTPVVPFFTVAACSLRTDTAVLAGSTDVEVVGLSTGRVLRSAPAGGAVVASADGGYVAIGQNGAGPVSIYRTSDLSNPVGRLEPSLIPLAFSGDGSLLLAESGDQNGPLEAVAWRTGTVAWNLSPAGLNIDSVVPRPGGGDFVYYQQSSATLVRRDGTSASFG